MANEEKQSKRAYNKFASAIFKRAWRRLPWTKEIFSLATKCPPFSDLSWWK